MCVSCLHLHPVCLKPRSWLLWCFTWNERHLDGSLHLLLILVCLQVAVVKRVCSSATFYCSQRVCRGGGGEACAGLQKWWQVARGAPAAQQHARPGNISSVPSVTNSTHPGAQMHGNKGGRGHFLVQRAWACWFLD